MLARSPADVTALGVACSAAEQAGDYALAAAYRSLSGGTTSSADATTAPPVLSRADADPFDAEIEALLHNESLTEVERPTIRLDDVGGLNDVKQQLRRSFLAPLQNPELRRLYGKQLRGGLLMYGPPGCGKTFIARAIAGELDAKFIALGLHDVLDMWLGSSERNLHDVFEFARRLAPCVLFLDEIDALGQKRLNLQRSAGRNVVVQLLNELDGVATDNEGVFVLGATNQPWDLDAALRRPGRFDRMLLVLPPDVDARVAILATHLRDRLVESVDLRSLARKTEGLSGADLRLVCETAAEFALDASLETGRARPISAGDLETAVQSVHTSTGPWFDTARNFITFANQSGEYDDLVAFMKRRRLL